MEWIFLLLFLLAVLFLNVNSSVKEFKEKHFYVIWGVLCTGALILVFLKPSIGSIIASAVLVLSELIGHYWKNNPKARSVQG